MIAPRRARLVRELGPRLAQQRLRFSSREAPKKVAPVKLYKSSELKEDQSYVSTADPKSMMRFYRGKVPEDESEQEREYRLRYEEVQLWNMRFWAKNNEAFQEGKKQFKSHNLNQSDDEHQQEQLLPYYKTFLDSNHKRNIDYNMEWYKKNLGLLIPAFRANLSRFVRKLKS